MSLKGSPAKYQTYVPPDLQGLRGQSIGLLQSLLGGGAGGLESFFGPMGSPASPLQRQSSGGIQQFLNQPAPEQRAMDISMPALQGILGGAPGQGIMDALRPQFDRNLASANQQGGRFGSGNAIMRSRALEDFNLLGAQAAQQGQAQQLQAAQVLGMLGGQAGQNPFSRLMGAHQAGTQDAQQLDLETQRRIQLMAHILGMGQQATMNAPVVQTQAASGGLGGFLGGLGGLLLGGATGGLGGGLGSWLGGQIFGSRNQR
jgi:hypothetical protein